MAVAIKTNVVIIHVASTNIPMLMWT